ncbi:MAG: DUF1080 domain-containing protein [Verrucomicrobiales bacterium]|nr:DUF1080 domain-containing protein [Verrucomicrobiales bacterium]
MGLLLAALGAGAAERVFDFQEAPLNQPPPGFHSLLAGEGTPGDWRVILDEVPPLLPPLSDKAPVVTKRPVLAQLSRDRTDERFPLLVFEEETFGDFTLTTRFKLVGGEVEQMAGIAFRLQDARNFYVIRASGLGRNLRFYKVVNGERSVPIGPQLDVPTNVWHELKIECKGNQIRCWFNGREAIPTLGDNTFSSGKIAFWTKSDSVSYFADTRLVYTPREPLAQTLVREMKAKYPRLRGLQIYTLDAQGEPRVVASTDQQERGEPGGLSEKGAITEGNIYYGKGRKTVTVVMPLRDRNGEPIAAARLTMERFTGQTEQNALARAMPIVKAMQARVRTLEELTQ